VSAVRAHKQKNRRIAPICFPSFVYRQDGHELSYKVISIIPQLKIHVKQVHKENGALQQRAIFIKEVIA
jgi:hypothetical protein